jgi:secreted PhoX family phosphatase
VSPLDEGTLYAARFDEDGTGEWLELSTANPALASWSIDEILVYTRAAADAAGATPMDRPEWTAVGPAGEVYCSLTNNTERVEPDAANPLAPNPDGHIIRWRDGDEHVGTTFTWDIFVLSQDVVDEAGQMFGSPDGLWVDPTGRVFVLTDGTQPGGANDQMLVADSATGSFRRLFTGVPGCEVTGITVTPDHRTLFVNLQHPGNGDPALTNWPEAFTGASGPVPRDSTVVIRRRDGGVVGE